MAARHPQSVNLGDITAPDFIERAQAYGPLDVLVAGTPCQAFSVAGLRQSLADARGNLTLRFVDASLRSASGGSSRTYVGVRRLMPVECERLQGMADGYTAIIEYNGKPAKDGSRYKAIGNSMAVPVLSWILRRIKCR